MKKTKTKKVVKSCGCTKPEMMMDRDGRGFIVKRLMCLKHAEQFKLNYPTS